MSLPPPRIILPLTTCMYIVGLIKCAVTRDIGERGWIGNGDTLNIFGPGIGIAEYLWPCGDGNIRKEMFFFSLGALIVLRTIGTEKYTYMYTDPPWPGHYMFLFRGCALFLFIPKIMSVRSWKDNFILLVLLSALSKILCPKKINFQTLLVMTDLHVSICDAH